MERNSVSAVVFDMAGTTVDEKNVVYRTLMQIVNQYGGDYSLREVLDSGGGKEKMQAIRDLLQPHFNNLDVLQSKVDLAFAEFKERLTKAYLSLDVTPCDGVGVIFSFLKSRAIKVVLNTGYHDVIAQNLIKKLNWQVGRDFDLLITADQVANSRPAPDMIQLAMDKLSIKDPSTVVKIGDTVIDIQEGRSAQCGLVIGITSGAQTRATLSSASPDYIIDNLIELIEVLKA